MNANAPAKLPDDLVLAIHQARYAIMAGDDPQAGVAEQHWRLAIDHLIMAEEHLRAIRQHARQPRLCLSLPPVPAQGAPLDLLRDVYDNLVCNEPEAPGFAISAWRMARAQVSMAQSHLSLSYLSGGSQKG
jgi:hypothetical protein